MSTHALSNEVASMLLYYTNIFICVKFSLCTHLYNMLTCIFLYFDHFCSFSLNYLCYFYRFCILHFCILTISIYLVAIISFLFYRFCILCSGICVSFCYFCYLSMHHWHRILCYAQLYRMTCNIIDLCVICLLEIYVLFSTFWTIVLDVCLCLLRFRLVSLWELFFYIS